MNPRVFRFAHQLRPAGPLDELIDEARRAEAAGFDVLVLPDHINPNLHSPMPLLAVLAAATETIRLGTFVLNNEMRNPVQLAWEAATLDRLSNGRFELGIGAGHTPQEFAATGIPFRPPSERKARLREAVEIIRQLLDGEIVSYSGDHYVVNEASIEPPVQKHLPLLVGGNGTSLLSHAARNADVVGLNGLGRTGRDGHRHAVRFEINHLDAQVETIRRAAGDSDSVPEINVLVQKVTLTTDRERSFQELLNADPLEGLTAESGLTTPFLAFGTAEEIALQWRAARDRWGISYFSTRDIDAVAPIVALLR